MDCFRRNKLILFVLAYTILWIQPGTAFDCETVSFEGKSYDIRQLLGLHVLARDVVQEPSTFHQELSFDLCASLEPKSGMESYDQVNT
jgi:hypothetical protein